MGTEGGETEVPTRQTDSQQRGRGRSSDVPVKCEQSMVAERRQISSARTNLSTFGRNLIVKKWKYQCGDYPRFLCFCVGVKVQVCQNTALHKQERNRVDPQVILDLVMYDERMGARPPKCADTIESLATA